MARPVRQALAHPVCAQLPAATRLRLKALQGLGDMLEGTRRAMKHGDMSRYQTLDDRIEGLPRETRDLLRQYLAYLTLTAPRPAEQLATCSEPVFDAICDQARARLDASRPNHQLAARLFQARHDLQGSRAPRAERLEDNVLAPTVPRWSRRDRGQVENVLKRDAQQGPLRTLVDVRSRVVPREQRQKDLSKEFKVWCKRYAKVGNRARGPQPAVSPSSRGSPAYCGLARNDRPWTRSMSPDSLPTRSMPCWPCWPARPRVP